jgi:nucleotide-binding universal stress UspA family protein
MNIQKILFPTDFSHYNDAALKLASSLAAEARATLYVIHVFDAQALSAAMGEAGYLYAAAWQEDLETAKRNLRSVVPTAAGVAYHQECLTGSPVPEILNYAVTHEIGLIVMASHGRSGLSRLLMGSVAEGVMRKASCPVLIVKQPAGESTPHGTVSLDAEVIEKQLLNEHSSAEHGQPG